jgi:hypothetical protein
MKMRHLAMLAALLVAAWLALFGDKTPNGGASAAVDRSTSAQKSSAQRDVATAAPGDVSGDALSHSSSGSGHKPKADITVLALRNRAELIGGASSSDGTSLFGAQSWTPPPLPVKALPPPAPTAPALPFTYLGKKREDTTWEVYLARGDTTLIVHDKSMIEGTYRVELIKPPSLTLTYLPLNQSQTLQIGDAD